MPSSRIGAPFRIFSGGDLPCPLLQQAKYCAKTTGGNPAKKPDPVRAVEKTIPTPRRPSPGWLTAPEGGRPRTKRASGRNQHTKSPRKDHRGNPANLANPTHRVRWAFRNRRLTRPTLDRPRSSGAPPRVGWRGRVVSVSPQVGLALGCGISGMDFRSGFVFLLPLHCLIIESLIDSSSGSAIGSSISDFLANTQTPPKIYILKIAGLGGGPPTAGAECLNFGPPRIRRRKWPIWPTKMPTNPHDISSKNSML